MGILFYEFLHGMPPFEANSLDDIKEKLINSKIKLKQNLSIETKDLIRNMLKTNHQKRFDID